MFPIIVDIRLRVNGIRPISGKRKQQLNTEMSEWELFCIYKRYVVIPPAVWYNHYQNDQDFRNRREKTMTILGIDPGIATVGFGVITAEGSRVRPVRFGAVTTPAGLRLSVRLAQVYDDVVELIETFRPDAVAVEELFFSKNITTGSPVAHGRGVILLATAKCGVPAYEYTPMQVKQAVCGYGGAQKKQVMEMVRRLLDLKTAARPDDASDALGLAICHARYAVSLLGTEGRSSECTTI